jgi:hypothetical protein
MLLSLAKLLLGYIQEGVDYIEKQKRLKDLHDAVSEARNNQDPTKLTELFGGKPVAPTTPS